MSVSTAVPASPSLVWRVDASFGYRFAHLQEGLQIQENLTSLVAGSVGTNIIVNDSFSTRNDFNGALLALQTEWVSERFSLQTFGKIGLGNMSRQVTIDGSTVITAPGTAAVVGQGGLLALPSNIGTYTSNHFAWIPELGLTAGWQVTPRLRATVGYSLLLMTNVVRPGDQIDRTVNPGLLPPALPSTPVRPIFVLRDSDVLIQGVRVGLEYRF